MGSGLRPDGTKIRNLRIQKGWPQEQLAAIADVSPRTIQRLEGGRNTSLETLKSVASAFELGFQDMLQDPPEEAPAKGIVVAEAADMGTPDALAHNELAQDRSLRIPVELTDAKSNRPDSGAEHERSGMLGAGVLVARNFSGFYAYIPFLKGFLGSALVVLLVAAAIRVSPLLLRQEPLPEIADIAYFPGQVPAVVQRSDPDSMPAKVAPGIRTAQNARTLLSSKRGEAKQASPMTGQGTHGHPILKARPGETVMQSANLHAPVDSQIDGPQDIGPADPRVEAEFEELRAAATTHVVELLEAPSPTFSSPAGGEQDKLGLAGLVGQGAVSGYNTLSKSFRQSGLNTAGFFSRVGGSFKRAF